MQLDEVVWAPRTIPPVPEEMEFEDSLTRRFVAHGPGDRPCMRVERPAALPARPCRRCGHPMPWGVRDCRGCALAPAVVPGDAEDDETTSGSGGWHAVLLVLALAVGAVAFAVSWSRPGSLDHRLRAPCTTAAQQSPDPLDC